MNKYEVEVEVCYVFAIEAEDPLQAERIAQMCVDEHAPDLERTIAAIYVEPLEEENTPTETVQRPPPGFLQPPQK